MENILWNLFINTGDIRYYLQYKGMKASDEQPLDQELYEVKEVALR